MMRTVWLVGLCLLVIGCGMSVAEIGPTAPDNPDVSEMTRRFVTLRQVLIGMSRTEVRAVLALPVIVGYTLPDRDSQQYKPLTEDNPRRSETLKKGRKTYEVDYYLVGIQKQDGQINDDELVPLVFRNGKLIGMGWEFLNKL